MKKDHDFLLKILAFVVAVVLWFYVVSEENPEITYDLSSVPVKYLRMEKLSNSGYQLLNQEDIKVTVRIKGRRNDILKLNTQGIYATVDLGKIKGKGENVLPVSINGIPNNIRVLEISPKEVTLILDITVKAELPLKPVYNGKPKDGFVVLSPKLNPDKVTVTGPESIIKDMKEVPLNLNVDGLSSPITLKQPVSILDNSGQELKGVTVSPDVVDVFIPVEEGKKVSIKPNIIGSVSEGYVLDKISVEPDFIILKGDSNLLSGIDSVLTEPIDISEIKGYTEKIVKPIIPPGVETINPPEKVVLKIDVKKKQ